MERAIPILPADDLRTAREFYVDKLGFTVAFEASEDGASGILGLERGGLRLTLDSPMSGHGRDACVSLEVASADAYYEEWSSRVDVLRPPRDETSAVASLALAAGFQPASAQVGRARARP